MSKPTTLNPTHSVTSSQGSEDGHSLSESPGGMMIDLFGQDHLPVSRLAATEKKGVLTTKDTYSLNGSNLLEKGSLLESLVNKLPHLSKTGGLTCFAKGWEIAATKSRRPFLRVISSGRPKDERGCILRLHPTPLTGSTKPSAHNAPSGTWKTALGKMSSGTPLATGGSSAINPAYPCWLMGFPLEWEDCAPMVTRSSRNLRRNSSKQQCEEK